MLRIMAPTRNYRSIVKIGDTAQFPIGPLGSDDVYRHRWEVVAFTRDGLIVRRRHDGLTRTIAAHWFERYRTDDSYHGPIRGADDGHELYARLDAMRARRLANVSHQTDPTQPSYYVSAIDRARGRHALLLGPFTSHYDALLLVPIARRLATPLDPYCQYGYGTCLAPTGDKTGRFNADVFNGVHAHV